jgi:hypothetical protein
LDKDDASAVRQHFSNSRDTRMAATGPSFMMKRRLLVLGAAGFSGLSFGSLSLFGCGGSSAPATTAPALMNATADVWDLSHWMWFVAGQSRVIDLSQTLPPDVVRGGAFGLASGSAPLPPGFLLQTSGLLTVVDPAIGQTANVQFTYAEPGT